MLHGWELIIVVLVVLLLFGAKKIPELGKGLGGGIKAFKQGLAEAEIEDEGEKAEGINDAKDEEAEKKLLS